MALLRILALSLLVMALAMPMRLHGLMVMPAHAASDHGPPHSHHQSAHHVDAAVPCHETDGSADGSADESERPVTSGGHASLHCATAGLVVPSRLVELPSLRLAIFEALVPAEMPLAEGLAPPRQERPPRAHS